MTTLEHPTAQPRPRAARAATPAAPGSQRLGCRVGIARFSPTPASVGRVRAATVRTLTEWCVDPDAIDTLALITTELASNAVKASPPGSDFVAIRLKTTGDRILLEVWDHNEARPELVLAGVDAEAGRGLALVDALASGWGTYAARSGGKVVWAEIPYAVVPAALSETDPMPTRRPQQVAEPNGPLTSPEYSTDLDVLARVAERLRALDDIWHLTATDLPVDSTPAPPAEHHGC
jgi:hypothetical protein